MEDAPVTKSLLKKWHGSFKSYLIGGIGSIIFTGLAFLIVQQKYLSGLPLVIILLGLAIAQALTQLLFFLHLGRESKPMWKGLIFILMLSTLLIILLGTFWIMHSLDRRDMNTNLFS